MDDAPRVRFPVGTLVAAAAVDAADWLGLFDLGLFSYIILLVLVQVPTTAYLTYWFYRRGTSAAGKRALRATWKRLFLVLGAEFVPYLEYLPWTVLFVYQTYRTEKKAALAAEPNETANVTRERRGASGPSTPESARAAGVTRSRRS